MANLNRLLKTSVIRLALKYALYNGILIAVGLGILFWATSGHVDAQIESGLQHEMAHLKEVDDSKGRENLISLLDTKWQHGLDSRRYYLLISKEKTIVISGLRGWPPELGVDGVVQNIWIEKDLAPQDIESQDGYWPMIGGSLQDGSKLLIAQSVLPAEDLLEFTLSIMAGIFTLSIGFTLLLGWILGRTILKKIDRINNTAKAITTGDLSQRMDISVNNDEFDELSNHLNAMLTRIEQLMSGMRQVTDNVAHDLRSPLSRMRNRLEVILLDERSKSEYRDAIEKTIVEAKNLIKTFNALLEIAQAEAGNFRGEWVQVDLSKIVYELGTLYSDLAIENDKHIVVEAAVGLCVLGNHHLLSQALNNLLDNALKHTPDGTNIKVQLKQSNNLVELVVSDDGGGISSDNYDKVLDRYTRLEASRSAEGNGLGFSLVKAVADLHHAELKLEDNQPGLKVTLLFEKAGNNYDGLLRVHAI